MGVRRCRFRRCLGSIARRTGKALSVPIAEEGLYDSQTTQRFAGFNLGDDRIPDETSIFNFPHLLERHGLTEAIFANVDAHLANKGIMLRSGARLDATIIDAPPSTKSKSTACGLELSPAPKGRYGRFG